MAANYHDDEGCSGGGATAGVGVVAGAEDRTDEEVTAGYGGRVGGDQQDPVEEL